MTSYTAEPTGQIEQWPDDPRPAVPDLDALRETVRRAEWESIVRIGCRCPALPTDNKGAKPLG